MHLAQTSSYTAVYLNKLLSGHPFLTQFLTHKQLETHGCILSIVATDALVLKHQAICIHNAD